MKSTYNSKACSVLPDSVEDIKDIGVLDSCERIYKIRWILSDVASPQPTSPPSSQVTFLTGYLNSRIFTNASCIAPTEIKSIKLNECSTRSDSYFFSPTFATATATVITIKKYADKLCKQLTTVQTISYKAGTCITLVSSSGPAGYIYSVTPMITSDITVPRVTRRSAYSILTDIAMNMIFVN